ncbi:substrate-binding domain-containing protein [Herbidospora sp. NBRC 101105]|uniref:substrate-binding domain-containing protein n=1 Tax=Herbidospora sp. NBRC 101105 TaxID=3032195 RepID=UPI00249FCCBF|nr:substrate-binding domain-containing protein [Herbidospora sp. NBRC 101105]GLX93398.1 hypothetical protein Hesp01_13480 [Herbidospora sp. NBRC 101105]
MDRRERKKAETRRAITGAALRLFAERGFAAVTVADVATEADVAVKTVFNYFPAKEQLFFDADPPLLPRGPLPEEPVPQVVAGWVAATGVIDRERARVYRDNADLRSHAREAFAAREEELGAGVTGALIAAAARRVWESAILRVADGVPAPTAAEEARDRLKEALASFAAPPVRRAPAPRADARRPSILLVAQAAGVSATTVSHTLNGRRPVAAETRRRVLEAIDRLGYRPNVLARGLRTNRSQTIGLVIPDITNPFYPALARGLQDVLRPAGYDEIISNTDGDRDMERAAIEQMIARQVDGLAFAVFHTHAEDLLPVIEAGLPVVRLGGVQVQEGVDLVHSDDEGGAAEATRYLLEAGYRRIGFVCGPRAEGPAAERVSGYRLALASAGIEADPRLVVHTSFSRSGGAGGTSWLLGLAEPPDAVLCANDIMALGALDAAAARGLRIPADLAVMGFDDIEAASLVSPRLTTMANPAREIGRACGERLLARLSGTVAESSTETIIPARLVRRESA